MKQKDIGDNARTTELRARTAAVRVIHEQLNEAEKKGDRQKAWKAAETILRYTTRRSPPEETALQPQLFNLTPLKTHESQGQP